MPISISGSGTITGISTGGLPDGCIATDDLANNAVTAGKMGTTEQSRLCAAWVNFNGTGTVAIRASYNVSSITDNGVGDYTVNFTSALPDANYSIVGLPNSYGVANIQAVLNVQAASSSSAATTKTSAAVRICTGAGSSGTVADFNDVSVAIFR